MLPFLTEQLRQVDICRNTPSPKKPQGNWLYYDYAAVF